MLTIACPTCRLPFGLPPTIAGKVFTCPSCGTETTVPRPEEIHRPGPSVHATTSAAVSCPRCSRVLRVPPDKTDGWIACPSCSLVFSATPAASPAPPPRAPSPPPRPSEPSEEEEPTPVETDDDRDDRRRRRRRRLRSPERRPATRPWVIIGIIGLLLFLSCAGWMIGVPYVKTRQTEITVKQQIEAKHGIPIERVDLVPHGDGYRGTVTPMRGDKLSIIITRNPDGSMRYFVW